MRPLPISYIVIYINELDLDFHIEWIEAYGCKLAPKNVRHSLFFFFLFKNPLPKNPSREEFFLFQMVYSFMHRIDIYHFYRE